MPLQPIVLTTDSRRSGDFFDSTAHPVARFHRTSFDKQGDDFAVKGDLTIRDVRTPVTLKGEINGPAKDPWGNPKVPASLQTKIARMECGPGKCAGRRHRYQSTVHAP